MEKTIIPLGFDSIEKAIDHIVDGISKAIKDGKHPFVIGDDQIWRTEDLIGQQKRIEEEEDYEHPLVNTDLTKHRFWVVKYRQYDEGYDRNAFNDHSEHFDRSSALKRLRKRSWR